MFTQLTNYILGSLSGQQAPTTAEGVENDTSRLTSAETEDEWVLVDRREDSDDDDDGVLVLERSPDRVIVVNTAHLPVPALLTRTSSASNLPRAMEESWFLTPPPCFISTGPVHMETSPLENLLIEHPSMSVYTHHGRRHDFRVPARSPSVSSDEEEEEPLEVVETADVVVVVRRVPRVNRLHVLQQQERQGLKGRRAQKVQIKNATKSFQRGNLDRTNKAREVNSRNRRQRRGERSQGATRSHANNNRKC